MTSTSTKPVYNFTGRRILITGGGRGIGRATVQKFYEANADLIVVLERDKSLLDDLVKEFPRVHPIPVDLSDWKATKSAVESVVPIHHIVNNAGIGECALFLDVEENVIDEIFQVNYKAVVNVSQTAVKGLISHSQTSGATIVNISSITDKKALARNSCYTATKAAVTMLTKTMALELAEYKIRVNCVRPGGVDTELLRLGQSVNILPPTEYIAQATLAGKLVTPEEVANTVIFLSSDASASINGTSITVDSGIEIH